MISIKFLGTGRDAGLARDADACLWLNTPAGMPVRMATGPANMTCLSCAEFDLAGSRWSSHGRAATCLKTRRLNHGRSTPLVPANTPACSCFKPRPDTAAVLAATDDALEEQAARKRAQVKDLQAVLDRLNEEIDELELTRGAPKKPGPATGRVEGAGERRPRHPELVERRGH